MKIFLGILATLLVLAAGVLGVLAVWGIYPVSWELIWKTGLTLVVSAAVLAALALVGATFFKQEKYRKGGGKAHPMN